MTPQKQPRAFWYRCNNCGTVMHAPVKAKYGEPYDCNLCHSWMRFLYYDRIPPEQYGRVVYNPGAQKERDAQKG